MEFSKRNIIIVAVLLFVIVLLLLSFFNKSKSNSSLPSSQKDFETEEITEEIVEEQTRDEVDEVIKVTPTINPNSGAITVSITTIPTKVITPTLTPTLRPTLIPTEKPDIDPEDTINWDEEEIEPTPTKTPTPDNRIYPSGVSLSATESRLYPKERQRITAKVEPDNATNKTVSWSSSNKSIATVTTKGLIKAIKTGTATITAKTINGKTTNVNVIVMESVNPTNNPTPTNTPTLTPTSSITINPESISLSDNQINLDKSQKKQITVNFNPSNTTKRIIRWNSSDSSIVTVIGGLITAKKSGTVTITATSENNKTDTLTVTVKETTTPSTPTPTKTPTPTPTKTPTLTPTKTLIPTLTPRPEDYFASGLTMYTFQSGNKSMGYWLYVPKNIIKTNQTPLLIFLHGIGGYELKTENVLDDDSTISSIVKSGNLNVFFLIPHSTNGWLTDRILTKGIIDKVVNDYNIDKSKIALTGHSGGGTGAYIMGYNYPNFFSCIVPVSATAISKSNALKMVNENLWVWHGANDCGGSRCPANNKAVVDAINNIGGHAKITIIPEAGHQITEDVYIDNRIIEWMIDQKR